MIFRSPYPEVPIPEVPLTPYLMERAKRFANKIAFIDDLGGRSFTYREFFEAVNRVASGLIKYGLSKGDVFAIFSPNTVEYAIAFHAVSLLGGIITTINPLYTAAETADQLKDAGARYMLTVPQLLDKAKEAVAQTQIREIFVIGEGPEAISFSKLLQEEERFHDVLISPREDLLALPYSSGTTGFPKGVMLTHYNIVANLHQIEATGVIKQSDVLICILPLFHIYGLVVIMNESLHVGATVVMMPRFDLESFLKALQDYQITLAPAVPPILLALSRHPMVDQYDLSRLTTIFSAAAPLAENVLQSCAERLGCLIRQGYGMTEASPATHISPDNPKRITIGSVGVLVPGTECRILDHTGEELGPGQQGEIWIRGPQVMKGYLNRPEETASTILHGWLRTGDIGYADEDGNFYIVDRAKELIKYKGFQVAPAELEAILLSHPAVADAAVIPVPDEEAGEIPKAFVVLKSEEKLEAILSFVAERVAPHKKIRQIERIDQIPKSPSGKILRRVLIEKERSQR